MICIFNDKDNDNDIQLLSEYIFITCTRLAHSFYCVKLEIQHLEIMRQLCQKTLFFFLIHVNGLIENIYIYLQLSLSEISLFSHVIDRAAVKPITFKSVFHFSQENTTD